MAWELSGNFYFPSYFVPPGYIRVTEFLSYKISEKSCDQHLNDRNDKLVLIYTELLRINEND